MTNQPAIVKHYIGGKWHLPAAESLQPVENPAIAETIAYVPAATPEEIELAVRTANEAFAAWRQVPVPKRARILFRYQQLLAESHEELARVVTEENGKSYSEAYGEVQRGIECVEFAAGAPSLMMGSVLPDIATGLESAMYRYPLGVVCGITPFNFPMMVPCWLFPLAIACGNTFVLKPSERTPLLACRLADLLKEAGLPDGVFNIVHGGSDTVNRLLVHPDIQAVSFVGSRKVADHVYRSAADAGKRVQALGGAKNHSIVLADADMELAVKEIVNAAFGSAGERCMACSVVVAVGEAGDRLPGLLTEAAKRLSVGDGRDPSHFLGPVIRSAHKAQTEHYIAAGAAEGAELLLDGRNHPAARTAGHFLGPTVFDRVLPGTTIWNEELFAPVLSIVRAESLQEAVGIANRSEFANGACLYTNSAKAIREFRETIDAGMIGINVGVPAPMAFFPFSGYKKSFYGDLHANGKDGVEFYTRKKTVVARY